MKSVEELNRLWAIRKNMLESKDNRIAELEAQVAELRVNVLDECSFHDDPCGCGLCRVANKLWAQAKAKESDA